MAFKGERWGCVPMTNCQAREGVGGDIVVRPASSRGQEGWQGGGRGAGSEHTRARSDLCNPSNSPARDAEGGARCCRPGPRGRPALGLGVALQVLASQFVEAFADGREWLPSLLADVKPPVDRKR